MGEGRSYRFDNRPKWSNSDRHSTTTYHERDIFREKLEERSRENDRRHRSRSPHKFRRSNGGWRDEKDGRVRNNDRRRDDREEWENRDGRARDKDRDTIVDHRDNRTNPRSEKFSSSTRKQESKRDTRSRSPEVERLERNYRARISSGPEACDAVDRISTPPVSFKVGPAQDLDLMDIDSGNKKLKSGKSLKTKVVDSQEDDEVLIEEDELTAMRAMMGFSNFGTTNQKKVPGNNVSAVRKEKRTEYRQYMNRVGGFNRPLSPSHSSR